MKIKPLRKCYLCQHAETTNEDSIIFCKLKQEERMAENYCYDWEKIPESERFNWWEV